jgi:putative DNA primase/helicase
VADAALASLESLLGEWLPGGHREGHEYKALNPTRADARVGSFSVNLNTGAWGDFATDDKGGDAISLYAYLQGISNGKAARYLADKLGVTSAQGPAEAQPDKGSTRARSEWRPIVPAPAEAGEIPKAHLKRGRPEAVWTYRGPGGELLGAVYRFRTSDGGKEVLPCVFAEHVQSGAREWRWLAFPDPRPLYGLDRLSAAITLVVVVEGEKCADALQPLLPPSAAALTWPGGSKAVDKADWSLLNGRKVIVWPDCDAQVDKGGALLPEPAQPGVRAAERVAERVQALGCEVRLIAIPAPGAKPSGWDVADAIAEGWTRDQVRAFLRDNLRLPACAKSVSTPPQAAPADDAWRDDLVRGGNGGLLAGVPNAFLMLTHRDEWRGVLAFDEFAQRPVKRAPPPYERGVAGDWEGHDDSMTAFWLATRAGLAKLSSAQAAEAAEMAARAAPFDPVRGYLDRLVWDRRERLAHWLADFFGAPAGGYAALVGTFWLIGMVRRVYEPGCKFDFMPILEGPQGRGKSSALEVLAAPWFGNTDFVMGDKDSMAVMQGKWLYEIAELDSFNKADTTRVKSFVSRQIDEFRPAYGRRIVKIPRRVVLVGTTNQYEYFKDASGNRRFWPIKCIEQIDVDALRDARDQLLAEAVVRYRSGERAYPTREEQETLFAAEQESREIGDAWEDGIHHFLEDPGVDGRVATVSGFEILTKGLHIEAGKVTKEMSTRVGIIMRKLGWTKRERRGEHPRYVYERPQKSAQVTPAQPDADGHVAF